MMLQVSAEGNEVLNIGRISPVMPEVCVELKGTGYQKEDISATLDSEKLAVLDVAPYDSGKFATRVYILVDLSTSMRDTFSRVKADIANLIDNLGPNDVPVLITIGETEPVVLLRGDEDRATAKDTVENLRCNEYGTVFYEALSYAYRMASASEERFDREYVITFSDGIDYQRGNTTFSEVVEKYKSHALPVYAACYGASKDSVDKLGEIARGSGGSISEIWNAETFNNFLAEINDVTIIKLSAETNLADGKEKQLSLKVGNSQIDVTVPIIRSIPDEEAPAVRDAHYEAANNTIVVAFTEAVNGAKSPNAYKISDEQGNLVGISSVFYSENADAYEITPQEKLKNGTYSIEFSGIKDVSREANPLTEGCSFTAFSEETEETDVVLPEPDARGAGIPLWVVGAAIAGLLLIIGAVVLIAVKSSGKKEDEGEIDPYITIPVKNPPPPAAEEIVYNSTPQNVQQKHHIIADQALRVRLKIKTGTMSEQTVDTKLISSLIVGRSATCDICIDDTKLSRQHFVIESDGDQVYIMDLQSRNGTMLNGMRINTRQKLKSGDKILAGLSDIIFTVIGR